MTKKKSEEIILPEPVQRWLERAGGLKRSVYRAGAEACARGEKPSDCPYTHPTSVAMWHHGFKVTRLYRLANGQKSW